MMEVALFEKDGTFVAMVRTEITAKDKLPDIIIYDGASYVLKNGAYVKGATVEGSKV